MKISVRQSLSCSTCIRWKKPHRYHWYFAGYAGMALNVERIEGCCLAEKCDGYLWATIEKLNY
jgi:hypothetical protein